MLKQTLATAILGMFMTTVLWNQVVLVDAPDTIYASLDTLGASGALEAHWDVVNGSENPLELQVTRILIDTVSPFNYPYVSGGEGSYERFCWGTTCFNYGTDSSPDNPTFLVSLAPGDSASMDYDVFRSDFYPNGVVGTTTLRYCIHPNFSVGAGTCHSVTYVIDGTTDLRDQPSSTSPAIASIQPNPASDRMVIQFEDARRGLLEFRNLVGQVVKAEPVADGAKSQAIHLDDMAPGIWLVTYRVDGIPRSTQRLVIR